MNMKKIGAYVLLLSGLAILALGIKPVYESVSKSFTPLTQVPQNMLLIIGLIVLGVGVFIYRFSSGSGFGSGKQQPEVPIYHGKNVVGFRRMGKK